MDIWYCRKHISELRKTSHAVISKWFWGNWGAPWRLYDSTVVPAMNLWCRAKVPAHNLTIRYSTPSTSQIDRSSDFCYPCLHLRFSISYCLMWTWRIGVNNSTNLCSVYSQFLQYSQGLGRERFIQFKQVDIIQSPAGFLYLYAGKYK